MHSPTNRDFQMLTPNSSPDELVIQQRGRRKVPIVFSPDIDVIKQVIIVLLILLIFILCIQLLKRTNNVNV